MESNLSRNNHYVSQMYLNAWKDEQNKVMIYNLLVPNSNTPLWVSKSVRSVGSIDSLFVRLKGNEEIDDIEKWFGSEYETPAKEALENAINGNRISSDEWHKLIDFVACHIVRTPSFLVNTLEKAEKDCVPIFEKQIDNISKFPEKITEESVKNKTTKINTDLFPIKITDTGDDESRENRLFKIETMLGKQFYLWVIKYLLETTTKVLHNHKWGIITVDERIVLPTSDDPVIFLNYNNEKDYNFGGGWGSKNSNILFPISPNKIMYTQIGTKCESRIRASYEMSVLFKKIIIEHSFRSIIANDKDPDVPKLKPRYVNLKEFKREKEMWEKFQKDYLEKESEYIK